MIMAERGQRMKVKNNREERKKEAVTKTNKDILPIRYYDDDVKAFVLEDGSYLDLFEKTADDIDNMLEDEIQYKMINFAKFLKMYKDDFKIVTLNFPTNTLAQQKHLKKIFEHTNDPVRRKWLQRSITELERADKGTRKKEYYFIIISENLEAHYEHIKQMGILGSSVREVSMDKKAQILYKLCNMNSLIVREDEEDDMED